MSAYSKRRAVYDAAYALAELVETLSLQWTPQGRRVSEWMSEPQFGDLVMVTFASPTARSIDCLGVYDSCWTISYFDEGETVDSQPWSERAKETIWRIRTFDGRYVNWSDITLRRIPRDPLEGFAAARISDAERKSPTCSLPGRGGPPH